MLYRQVGGFFHPPDDMYFNNFVYILKYLFIFVIVYICKLVCHTWKWLFAFLTIWFTFLVYEINNSQFLSTLFEI